MRVEGSRVHGMAVGTHPLCHHQSSDTCLGWNTCDPREYHPEYWRFGDREAGERVDYALFGKPCVTGIGNGGVAPDIVIEAKRLHLGLEEHVEQLQRSSLAEPPMTGRAMAVAVLTNGVG